MGLGSMKDKQMLFTKNTEIAFSPSIIAGGQLIFTPFNSIEKGKLDLALVSKYVTNNI